MVWEMVQFLFKISDAQELRLHFWNVHIPHFHWDPAHMHMMLELDVKVYMSNTKLIIRLVNISLLHIMLH